jgi:hypothetical protein
MHDDQLPAIDDWIEKQGTRISRPEAIRRLVEDGLKAKKLSDLAEPLKSLEPRPLACHSRRPLDRIRRNWPAFPDQETRP